MSKRETQISEIQHLLSSYECDGFREVEVKAGDKGFNIVFYAWDDCKIIFYGVRAVELVE